MSTHHNHIRLRLARAQFDVDVELHLPAQGITVLFGASGSGKTSILRCVAGLERPSNGLVRIGTATWQDDARGLFLPTWRRPIGYVFQEASLFMHLSVRRNLEYGLRRAGAGTGREALDEAIELLGIGALLPRRPAQLSGGERQRVAIARALATRPRLLLLDEPLASLDQPRRREIIPWLERLRDQLAVPMLYVTHSTEERDRLADHVVVLDHGRALSTGPAGARRFADGPALPAGEEAAAVLRGTVVGRDARWHLVRVKLAGRCICALDEGSAPGAPVALRVPARDVGIALDEPSRSSPHNHLPGIVQAITADDAHPALALVHLSCEGQVLMASVDRKSIEQLRIAPGLPVWAWFGPPSARG